VLEFEPPGPVESVGFSAATRMPSTRAAVVNGIYSSPGARAAVDRRVLAGSRRGRVTRLAWALRQPL